PDFNCAFDGAWVHEWRDRGVNDSAYRIAFMVERKMAKNLWFSLSLGKELGHDDGKNPTLLLGGIKLGYSQEPVLARDRPQQVTSVSSNAPPVFSRLTAPPPAGVAAAKEILPP